MANATILTIDVEPDWGTRGVRAFREVTPRFLRFLQQRGIRATFFVCSDLMDESADLVRRIARRHELGSHGRGHRTLARMSPAQALREMRESRSRLEEAGGRVLGFRAPFFRRCRDHLRLVRQAGYAYDASVGSVVPGPHNAWLGKLPCPCRRDGVPEFPTSSMGGGMVPLSLTWLRLLDPVAVGTVPRRASMVYLHLHEFLPPDSASVLPPPLRWVLGRNCGERAWEILDRTLSALDSTFVTCSDLLEGCGPGTLVGSGEENGA